VSCGALGLTACAGLEPASPLQITMDVRDAQASPSDPALMTVTVINHTSTRVVWGTGSSSCTLGGAVRVGGTWLPILAERICTEDMAEQGLDPGKARTEAFSWFGAVRRNGRTEFLPAGTYEARGEAGSVGVSRAVTITIVGAA
jgi:hypothetical protein